MVKQRIIKLRFWDFFHKKFRDYYADEQFTVNEILRNPYNGIFQQFTGLLDKNNKEIFEGDIVKQYGEYNQSYNTEVIFVEGRFIPLVKVEYGYNAIDRFDNNHFEIVGNIFENPDLKRI